MNGKSFGHQHSTASQERRYINMNTQMKYIIVYGQLLKFQPEIICPSDDKTKENKKNFFFLFNKHKLLLFCACNMNLYEYKLEMA